MQIALVAPPWLPVPPAAYGGTEAVIDTLARGLSAAGHDVLLVSTGDSTCPVRIACVLERAQGGVNGGTSPELSHVTYAYAHEFVRSADVVHDHTLIGPLYAIAADRNLPLVTTNHGPFVRELTDLYRVVGAHAAVIAISDHQAAEATGVPIAAVIHHGIDVDAVPIGDGGGGYVAFLGRMAPEKGVDIACRAARAAGVPLRIAAKMAEPEEQEYFEAEVRPLLGRDVEYVGELTAAEKFELLGHATALLNPIQWAEPFGMVMLESLACGTPVIATAMGSAPELINDGVTGILVHDEARYVTAIDDAASLSRRRCRAAAETEFSAARNVEQHLLLYSEVQSGDRSPRRHGDRELRRYRNRSAAPPRR